MAERRKARWFETFFDGLWAECYAKDQRAVDGDAKSIANALNLAPGATLLDVPSGDGRWSLAFEHLGYKVTAQDQNVPIAIVHQGPRTNVHYQRGDMREISLGYRVDAVVCLGGSFGYFGDSGDRAFLRSVSGALVVGGRFACDLHVMESLLPIFAPSSLTRIGHLRVEENRRYDPASSLIYSTWTFQDEEKVEKKESRIRLYSCREIVKMCKSVGLRPELFGSWELGPFELGSSRLHLLAKKI